MKGDFTRLTFRPEKHYTSVRMQQGRLQLDSDWNEQADIQGHLYRTQVVDLIGSESGAPTSENDPADPNKAYKDSFKISATDDGTDLVIAPERFYVNGILCELEHTEIGFEVTPSNQVKVDSLILDGRKFEKDQWVKIAGTSPTFLKIAGEVNVQTLELPLNGSAGSVGSKGKLSRALTYKTQSDYPNLGSPINGVNLAYLDVWQHHITTIEDPDLREPALNTPDTTTRTKTVWQLKLQPLNRKFVEGNLDLLDRLKQLSVDKLNQSFEKFLTDAAIPLAQQADAKTKFAALLDTVVQPSIPSWRKQFETILQSLVESEQNELNNALDDLLTTVQSTDIQPFDQLLAKVTLTSEQETNSKIPFKVLLAKVVPLAPEQKKSSFKELLAKTTSTQEEDKTKLQQPFDELLSKIAILTAEEQTQLQKCFNDLQAAPTSASPDEKTTWTNNFTALLPKISLLTNKKTTFQAAFKTYLEKAIASDPVLKNLESYEKDETIAGDLKDPQWIALAKDAWRPFAETNKQRQPLMNACAKLCPAAGGATASDSRYRRLENQLYRVEIHDPGKVGRATFKWSRDNGSVVSLIEPSDSLKKHIITIRKSAQDAWATSKSGQWIEFLDEERELKGEPGRLARLNRVSGNKIEFDGASLVGQAIQKPTKVRRWDHMTKEASIPTRTEWIELEAGIKVQFDSKSEYKTGDYWLIPARAATNDIEWPNDQAADLNKRQPLAQAALGIDHDYCLLAAVEVADGKFRPLDKEQDYRFIFPSLVNAFDKRGGVITGDLEVQKTLTAKELQVQETLTTKNLKVTGEFTNNQFKAVTFAVTKAPTSTTPEIYGLIQVGADDTPKRVEFAPGAAEVFAFTQTSKIGIGATDFTSRLGVLGNVAIGDNAFLKSTPMPDNGLIVLGQTGLGTSTPKNQLDVLGAVAIGQGFAGTKTAPTDGLLIKGKVAINIDTPDPDAQLHVKGNVQADKFKGDGSELTGVVKTTGNNVFNGILTVEGSTFLASNPDTFVGIDVDNPASKLTVNGNAAIGGNYAQTEAPKNGLLVEGHVGIGKFGGSPPSLKAKLEVQGANDQTTQAALRITNPADKSLLWVRNDGHVGIGVDKLNDINENLHVNGGIQCDRLVINNLGEPPVNDFTQDNPRLYVNGSLFVAKKIFVKEVLEANQFQGEGFHQVSSRTLKDQVSDLSSQEVERILQTLNPVKFVYTEDATKSLHAGFIAEDTSDLLTSTDKQAVKIMDVVAVLTRAVKDQQAISEELSHIVNHQRSELEILREKLKELEERNIKVPQTGASTNPLDDQAIRRSPRGSRHTSWSFFRKLKRLIRYLFSRSLG